MGTIRVGTQGWNYRHWVGPFYPDHTQPEEYLRTYARAFDTVEIDSTFYAVPSEETVKVWASRVPDEFRFACKLPQKATHVRHLVDARDVVAEFADRMRALGSRLGPILIQLGPEMGPEHMPALERFLPLLPRDLRFAVEFRRQGWLSRVVLRCLAEHNVALALVEGRWFRRDAMLRLPASARRLQRLLGIPVVDPAQLAVQRGLF